MFKRKKNKAVVEETVVNNETKNIEVKEEKLDSRNPDFSGFSVEEDKGIRKSESIKEIVKEEQKENEETKTDKKDIEKTR